MHRILIAAVAAFALAHPSAAQPAMPVPVLTDPGPSGTRIAETGVFANLFPAAGEGRRPAVLLLGGSEGGLGPGATREAAALQAAGFTVLQLCYYGCSGTPDKLADVPLETFDRGLAWISARPDVDPRRIAIVGGSKGAEAALLVASRHPELKAVIATMPSSVSWPGITYSATPLPSWTEGGKPVAFLPYIFRPEVKTIFDIYNHALPGVPQHPEAVIAVERITGPILLVCGEADTLWPSCPMSDQIAARLKTKGRPAPTILRYADAGHGVFGVPVDKPSPGLASLGGTVEGNAAARVDDWPKAVAFLTAHLAP